MSKVDLLLVNPGDRAQMYEKLGYSISAIEPPVWTGLIASFIRVHGFSVKIIDQDAEGWDLEYTVEKIIESEPLLVGIGALGANPSASSTPKMVVTSKLLNAIKNKSSYTKTFVYGIHPSALPEKTLKEENVDFVCRGECFYSILELLGRLKNNVKIKDYKIKGLWYVKDNEIIVGGWSRLVKDVDTLPFIAWDLLPMDKYRAHNWHCFDRLDQRSPYAVIYTSLGCPYQCTYCSIHAMYNGKPGIRFRSLKKVVEEIDFLVKKHGVKNIKILDELFVLKQDRVMEFCDLIIQGGYDLNIWAYARIDTINEKMLKRLKQAGVNWLAFGIESASNKVRKTVSKDRFDRPAIKRAINMTHGAGIYICANFIFGLPDDNIDTMQETLDLAKELNCEYTNFYVAMAYPGSQLYNEAVSNGIEIPDSWSGFAQFGRETFPLATKHLTNKDVLYFRDKAFYEYHSSLRYLNMMRKRFGQKVVEHMKELLKYKLKRKLLEEDFTMGDNKNDYKQNSI